MSKDRITITADHLKLLRRANITEAGCYLPVPAFDPKMPFGNSDVEQDIARILGWDFVTVDGGEEFLTQKQGDRARELLAEMSLVLSVLVRVPGCGLTVGDTWERESWREWQLIKGAPGRERG